MKIMLAVFQPIRGDIPSSGVGKMIFELNNFLKSRHNVTIFFSIKGNIKDENVKTFGYLFIFFFRLLGASRRFFPYHLIRYYQEIIYDIFLYFQIDKSIDYFITTNAWTPLSVKKAKKMKIKTIFIAGNPNDNFIYKILVEEKVKLHIDKKDAFDFEPRLKKYNQFIRNIDSIISINQYINDTFYFDKSLKSKKLELLPFIFDANYSAFNTQKTHVDKFRVFYCAHSTTLKGLQYLIPAFKKFQENKIDVELIIGGRIDPSIQRIIEKKINDKINYIGHLTSLQIAEVLISASIFVVPSITDAAPVTLIEAMYSKTPVICSTGVGHQWLIEDGVNGFIYNYSSTKELIQKLEECYKIRKTLPLLGLNARKKIDEIILNKGEFYINFEKLLV
jgi:glycosyltransferase involved in cell wall biosynthesis